MMTDQRPASESGQLLREVRVRQLMSPAPASIDQFDTVMAAARRMRASGATWLPVSDERAQFVGLFSDRAIIELCVADGHDPRATTVGTLLPALQVTIDPDRIADAAVLAMVVRQGFELPVVENGVLVGMLSLADIALPLLDDETSEADVDEFWPTGLVVLPIQSRGSPDAGAAAPQPGTS